MTRCRTGFIGERVRVGTALPLRCQQPCLAGKVVDRLIGDARVELIVDDDDRRTRSSP